MNMEPTGEKEEFSFFTGIKNALVITLVLAGITGVLYFGFTLSSSSNEKSYVVRTENIICNDIHSPYMDQDGWRRANPLDRSKGHEFTETHSLECFDSEHLTHRFVVRQRWIRPSQEKSI